MKNYARTQIAAAVLFAVMCLSLATVAVASYTQFSLAAAPHNLLLALDDGGGDNDPDGMSWAG